MRTLVLRNERGHWLGDIAGKQVKGFKSIKGYLVIRLNNTYRVIKGNYNVKELEVAAKKYNTIDLNDYRRVA